MQNSNDVYTLRFYNSIFSNAFHVRVNKSECYLREVKSLKSHGHFKTREEAESWKEYLENRELEKLKNPRVRWIRRFWIKQLSSGKYSVQSNKVIREGFKLGLEVIG